MSEILLIDNKIKSYLQINKEINELKQKQKEQKKILEQLENEIHEYMSVNNLQNISLPDGNIVIYDKKTSQSFKRPAIVEKLTEKLNCDEKKAGELAEALLGNKVFTIEKKLKAQIKKKNM
jgi:hypothetical protein